MLAINLSRKRPCAWIRLPADVPTLAEQLRAAGFATAAFVGSLALDRRFGLDRGFGHYGDRMSARRSHKAPVAERSASEVVDAALAWLETAPDRFFLWVHLYDPHRDYDPPKAFLDVFPADAYAGEIAFADAEAGRLIDALRARWGRADTLVAMTSDHGESLGEHGESAHGYGIYDATQRIPLVISAPGLPPGLVVNAPVRLVDVAPTILALAAARALPDTSGRDLRPVWEGVEPTGRVAYLETLATRHDLGWSPLFGVPRGRRG